MHSVVAVMETSILHAQGAPAHHDSGWVGNPPRRATKAGTPKKKVIGPNQKTRHWSEAEQRVRISKPGIELDFQGPEEESYLRADAIWSDVRCRVGFDRSDCGCNTVIISDTPPGSDRLELSD